MSNGESANRTVGEGTAVGEEIEANPVDMLVNLVKGDGGASARRAAPPPPPSEAVRPVAPINAGLRQSDEMKGAARALAAAQPVSQSAESAESTALLRMINGIRTALPYIQKILPLLDGNVVTAIANVLTPQAPQAHLQAKSIDLSPLESALTEVKSQHREMRSQLTEQGASLKRFAEQLDQVREITDRSRNEQEELIEELKVARRRLNLVAFFAFALLTASIAMNVVLYLEMHRMLP